MGHGELWAARLLAARLRAAGSAAALLDARAVLLVEPTADGASVDVDYAESNARLDAWAARAAAESAGNGANGSDGLPDHIVVTGFIASNRAGQATTLRRNGSDYSATIFGALAAAGEITIWTDVDGVFSADPRRVPEAVCLESLSYHEARCCVW